MKLLSSVSCLCLMLVCAEVRAEERWEHLGDVLATATRPRGELSLNLDSLRRRGGHYEIWERVVFTADPRPGPSAAAAEAVAEQRTLWAIRCRAGEMARVTEGDPASIEPRASVLKFYSPGQHSAGAAVIETACGEARRIFAARKAMPADAAPAAAELPEKPLERPPAISDLDSLEADDE